MTYNGNPANYSMNRGYFSSVDGFIYFSHIQSIYEYDLETGKTVRLEIPANVLPRNIFAATDGIYYYARYPSIEGSGEYMLYKMTREGKNATVVSEKCDGFCADGVYAYYKVKDKGFVRKDIATGTEQIIWKDNYFSFYIGDSSIYLIAPVDDVRTLFISPVDEISFEKVDLSFEPVSLVGDGKTVYLSTMALPNLIPSRGQVIKYEDGVETPLPIYAQEFQLFDNHLIYKDQVTIEDSGGDVVSYDLETGETEVLCERVFDFAILEDRYICFWCMRDGSLDNWWVIYDWQTGETKQMYP